MCVVHHVPDTREVRRSGHLELEVQRVVSYPVGAGIEPGSSARTTGDPNCWVISPAYLGTSFYQEKNKYQNKKTGKHLTYLWDGIAM